MPSEEPSVDKQPEPRAARQRGRAGVVALRAAFDDFRVYLSSADALLGLSLLGVAAGAVTGAVIVAFRLLTEWSLVLAGVMPKSAAASVTLVRETRASK